MSDHDEDRSRPGRRDFLRGVTAAGLAAALPGCDDGEVPLDDDAGTDAGPLAPPDAGPPPGPVPPRERSYATFEHGVASGDPLPNGVILWTRVTPGMPGDPDPGTVEVTVEVARDVGFGTVDLTETVTTDASRDFTVKLDRDLLDPATTYYYRFTALGDTSPIGRTRTAPDGPVDRLRLAICSCASLGHGFLHGYGKIAARADLDAVVHLGDYIYEYGNLQYGNAREYEPATEIIALDDYRARFSQYRREPELAEAHRQHPFITIWDDHETANNSWRGGAENHDPDEGAWADRLAAATQAYREWMPIRDGADPAQLWRKLGYGELLDLIVVDTRIWGRDEELPRLDAPGVDDEARQLLGADQEAWLIEQLSTSTARWKLIGNQVMIAPIITGFANPDQWDGYPAARARVLGAVESGGVSDVVVLTGDIHSSWAFDLPTDVTTYDPDTGAGAVGVELVTPGISSPGFPDIGADRLAMSLMDQNPHLTWAQLTRRGYVVLDLDEARMQADWYFTGDVEDETDTSEMFAKGVSTATGASHLVDAPVPADDAPDAPPLAP